LNQWVGTYITYQNKVLSRLPETKAIFSKKDGSFYKIGDIFPQPELAKTLREVAKQGASYMYTGEWAKKLVEAVGRDGGKMTMEDLKNYKVIWADPLEVPYGDYIVHALAEPSWGGVNLAEALNVSREANLTGMGHYSKSSEAFFWLDQISRLSLLSFFPEQQRSNMLGGADASNKTRITKAHAQRLWAMISKGGLGITRIPDIKNPEHTDAVVVIDRWGNMAVLVHSINTVAWGNIGIFVDGISISDAANSQQQLILETGSGKRLPEGTEPLIISKNGKPFIALSSTGSGLYNATLSVLLNIMGYNMGLKEAIDAPSQHAPKYNKAGTSVPQVFAGDFSDELINGVKELGLDVEIALFYARGCVIGAMIDSDGKRKAVTNPYENGVALGY
jgi:gamma-glutamyltranspeptidase/glutathione hydrolase